MYNNKENGTFHTGDFVSYNACVGYNGTNDLETYEIGYDIAVKQLINSTKSSHIPVDAIIYPIAFCARQKLELFLKDMIKHLGYIKYLINNCEKENLKLKHELDKLFQKFSELTLIDSRCQKDITIIEKFVKDFHDIDPTGQTFRYPESTENTQHLIDLSCINIIDFEKIYIPFSAYCEKFRVMIEFLIEEYIQKTFIDGVSRNDIFEISKMLPQRYDWGKPEFLVIKKQIMEKFKISSNKFSKVLNIIQKHTYFSLNIGIENKIKTISSSEFNNYLGLYSDFIKRIENESFNKVQNEISNKIIKLLPKKVIYSLCSLKEIGNQNLYPEYHEQLFTYYSKLNLFSIVFDRLVRTGYLLFYLKKGLLACGQKTLLEELEQFVKSNPHLLDSYDISRRPAITEVDFNELFKK